MKSQFNYKRNPTRIESARRCKNKPELVIISIRNNEMLIYFGFRKEKCASWLGLVFLKVTSAILDDMRLETDNPDPEI
jgi:hypothetical protein